MAETTRRAGVEMATAVASGIIATLLVAVLTYAFRGPIAEYVAQADPTCTEPTGLVQVPRESIEVKGPSDGAAYRDVNINDGYLGSLWVPPRRPESLRENRAVFFDDEGRSVLTVRLDEVTDVALVCVNNGIANNRDAYENWGRVRTVTTWVDKSSEGVTTTLASLPPDEMQTSQEIAADLDAIDHFNLRVRDAYGGSTIQGFDPNWCGGRSVTVPRPGGESVQLRHPRGCLVAPAPRAGISELIVYEEAP